MSLALVHTRALSGLSAPEVVVEVHLANGLPAFNLVGLPEAEVREARDRVRAAISTSGFEFPPRRITVNLAPADLPKEGGRFDLPIALGILAASEQISAAALSGYEFAGELSLNGNLRSIHGALPMALEVAKSGRRLVIPLDNGEEAALVDGACVLPAGSLLAVCAHLHGRTLIEPHRAGVVESPSQVPVPDLTEVKGQQLARRALEVAAAGQHSLLMFGPPGTGKSMLAQRLPGILPPMSEEEAVESASLQSLEGHFDASRWRIRPYRAPHHSSSVPALVGGGANPKPGEISLAHHGVLFLDELPEFDRKVLEVLREPLENGEIHISRAARQAVYPAKFQLVAAMNPCPCGYLGHPVKPCRCTPDAVARYRSKISGPLLDRIDLTIEVPSLSAAELMQQEAGECSADVLARVEAARARQYARQGKVNAALSVTELDGVAAVSKEAGQALGELLEKLSLSARSFHRIMRVARTLADLAGDEVVGRSHVLRAVSFRRAL